MTKGMGTIKCYVCSRIVPTKLANEHHRHPREAGGSDVRDNIVWLCPSCHQSAHRLSETLMKGQDGTAIDMAGVLFSDPAQRGRLLELARLAASYLQEFRETTPKAALATTNVTIELDTFDYAHLKTLASERKVHGRRLGVPTYIQALVKAHLKNPSRSL